MLTNESKENGLPEAMRSDPTKKKRKKIKNLTNKKSKTWERSVCTHHFVNELSRDLLCLNCECRKRGYCLPQCMCSVSCPLSKVGCRCRAQGENCRTNKCICFRNKIECVPEVCKSCCNSEDLSCCNLNILKKKGKRIKIGVSSIS